MKRLDELGISPAPWKVGEDYDYCFVFDGKEERAICAIQWAGTRDENGHSEDSAKRANARLIAAAPNLYRALLEAVEKRCGWCAWKDGSAPDVCAKCDVPRWRKALEKAGGGE